MATSLVDDSRAEFVIWTIAAITLMVALIGLTWWHIGLVLDAQPMLGAECFDHRPSPAIETSRRAITSVLVVAVVAALAAAVRGIRNGLRRVGVPAVVLFALLIATIVPCAALLTFFEDGVRTMTPCDKPF